MDSGTNASGDERSFHSTTEEGDVGANGGAAATTDEWFTILTLPQCLQRTLYLCVTHPIVLLRTTVTCVLPSFVLAIVTAVVHEHEHADPATYIRELPFTEILQDLPLVLWHLVLMLAGCLAAQGYTVRYLAETVYAANKTAGLQTLSNHSSRRNDKGKSKTPWRPSTLTLCTLAAAGLWILVSILAVALAGHFLAVGLWDLRQNAARTHRKHPHEWILGFIVVSCSVMILAVVAVALFGVAWLCTCYTAVVPLIVLQGQGQPSAASGAATGGSPLLTWSSTASLLDNLSGLASNTGNQMLEAFRQSYVLARGAHNFIDASLFLALAPVVTGVVLVLSLPLYVKTHHLAMDFVDWMGGTPQGVVALYGPVLAVLPLLSIQQTVVYVTLRVAKEEYTREALLADLKQSSSSGSEYAPIDVDDDDDDEEAPLNDGFQDEPAGGLEMQDIPSRKSGGAPRVAPE